MVRSCSPGRATLHAGRSAARDACSPTPAVERADIRVIARFADPIAGSGGHDATADEPRRRGRSDAAACRAPWPARTGAWPSTATRWCSRCPGRAHRRRDCGSSTATATEHVHEFDGSGLTIGRAADNDLVALRQPRVAPPRPDRRPTGHARLRRPRQHQRVARERRRRSVSSSSARATGSSSGDTVIMVEVAGDVT